MRTRDKIRIDQTIIKPLIYCLNIFVRILGKLLRIDHRLDKEFKIIAVAKYKGLGSIIQSTPLLQTLRLKFSNAHIVFVTTQSNLAILKKIDCVNEIVTIDDKNLWTLVKTFVPFMIKLIRLRIEVFLDLEIYSNFSSFVTTLSLAKNRVGYYLRSSNYRMGIYTHMMYYNIRVPVSQTYLQFSRLLNCTQIVNDLYPLTATETSISINNETINLTQLKYILVNPNASDLRLERRWEGKKYAALITLLQEYYPNHHIYLLGGREETSYVNDLYSNIQNKKDVFNLAGKTNMNELICLIQYASCFITNDTGPMHIGYSLGTKMVALFGPCSPEQYGQNKNCYNIYHKVYCSPCVHEFIIPPCGGDNQCMKLISMEEVLSATKKMLGQNLELIRDVGLGESNIYETISHKGEKIPLGLISRTHS